MVLYGRNLFDIPSDLGGLVIEPRPKFDRKVFESRARIYKSKHIALLLGQKGLNSEYFYNKN